MACGRWIRLIAHSQIVYHLMHHTTSTNDWERTCELDLFVCEVKIRNTEKISIYVTQITHVSYWWLPTSMGHICGIVMSSEGGTALAQVTILMYMEPMLWISNQTTNLSLYPCSVLIQLFKFYISVSIISHWVWSQVAVSLNREASLIFWYIENITV